MRRFKVPDQAINGEDEEALRALVKELVRRELEGLDQRVDARVDAALKRSVLALRPSVRTMEYK